MEESYAIETLRNWHRTNEALFQKHCVSQVFNDTGHGSAAVRLETENYLVELTAWNHASCLDIQILEMASEKSTFPTVGDCESKAVFENHLLSFMEWFNSEMSSKA